MVIFEVFIFFDFNFNIKKKIFKLKNIYIYIII